MRSNCFVPSVEQLESRLVPYALSGAKWAVLDLSASFMPDQSKIGTQSSNLFSTYDAKYATQTWQAEFARALQTWATVTPLNFRFVADSGAPQGAMGPTQGNVNFGDIRLGAYNAPSALWLASAAYPSPFLTKGGDITLNSKYSFNIGSNYDLYSVLLHESGHSLGLAHSTVPGSVLGSSITGVYTGLHADDVAGIRAIYGARKADSFDTVASNDTLATASLLSLNATGGVTFRADLTTTTDVDTYKLTVPAGSNGTLTVTLDPSQISLMIPKLSLFNSAGQLVGSATAASYGSAVKVTLTGVTAGQTYYLQANGATSDVFHVGGYMLNAQFGGFGVAPYTPTAGTTTTTGTGSGSGGSAYAMPIEDHDCDDHHHETPANSGALRSEQSSGRDLFGFSDVGSSSTPFGLSVVSGNHVSRGSHHRLETAQGHDSDTPKDRLFHEIWSHKSKKSEARQDDASVELAGDFAAGDLGATVGGDAA